MVKRMIVVIAVLVFAFSYVNAEEKEPKTEGFQSRTEGEGVLAEVNGFKITLKYFEEEVAAMPANYRGAIDANKRKFLDELILRELLSQEAVKKALDKDQEVVGALEKFKKKLLAQKLIMDVIGDISVSEDESKKYYEEHKDDFKAPEEMNAAHILVKVEESGGEAEDKAALEKAEGLLKKIKKGSDFSELAKENSDCPSGSRGGELGYFTRGRMVPEFEEAVFKLKVGEVSDIVKTKFGYHIIKALEKKEVVQKGFDEVREEIEEKLVGEKRRIAFDDYIEALKGKAKITVNEELL